MDIQNLESILRLQAYISMVDGILERLDGYFTPSEKALVEEWREQYIAARGALIQQSGIVIPTEKVQKELPPKEPVKEQQPQKEQKKEQPVKKSQKQLITPPQKEEPDYPE